MSVSFSPDGRSLASGSTDNTIKLWDVASGSELRTLRGHSYYIYSVTFSPNGRYLASGSGDHTIKLWDVASGSELRTLSGDQSWVNSVAFSPDGRYLASGSGDKTIKLWNVEHLVTAQQAQAQSGQIRNEAGSQAADAEQAVRNAVTAWVEAFRSKDAKALAECYAPFVEIYFRQHNLSHEQIKRYIESTFARTLDIRKYEVSDIRVQTSPAVQGPTNVYSRATAVFHKEWETSETSGKTFAGEEIEQLTFTNSPQGWQIVREEELKILRVARR
jgi:ketosteroid isomerase-like protein